MQEPRHWPVRRPAARATPNSRKGWHDHDDRSDDPVTGGVDTHKDTHVAAALDGLGRLLGTESFPATTAGYRQLLRWLRGFGEITAVGVEGTGAWGAGLARFLTAAEIEVVEVQRPNRQHRRRHGKSDPVDAIGAARAVLSGEASGAPKTAIGQVESIRLLQVARRSAMKARSQAANQIHSRDHHRPRRAARAASPGSTRQRLVEHCARFRRSRHRRPDRRSEAHADGPRPPLAGPRRRDRRARRAPRQAHHRDARRRSSRSTASAPRPPSALLSATGDNPDRLSSEASFAALCGSLPARRVLRPTTTAPPQPRRRPPSQRRALHHRDQPTPMAPRHPGLHGPTPRRRQDPQRSHPLPQALRRPPSPPSHPHRPRATHNDRSTASTHRCLTSIEASASPRRSACG